MRTTIAARRRLLAALLASSAVCAAATLATTPAGATTSGIAFANAVPLDGGCGGEPSIDTDGKGHVYVSSPKGILAGVASCDGVGTLTRGVATWVSSDGGATWGPKISVGSTNGGGDSDTVVDQTNGDVYVADLEAVAADICVSHDHGQTYVGAAAPNDDCSAGAVPVNIGGQTAFEDDREWVNVYGPTAAYPHKDVFVSFHDFAAGIPLIYRSQDGGAFQPLAVPAFTDPTFMSAVANGTVMAKPVIDRDGTMYALVTTQAAGQGPLNALWLIKSADHGATWTDVNIFNGPSTAQMGLVFNDLAIDGGGDLYALSLGNESTAVPPVHAYLFTSTDHGATWSSGVDLNTDGKALALAALHGGPQAGQVVAGFYHSVNTTDPNDLSGMWKYEAVESTDAIAAHPTFHHVHLGATENDQGFVHQGQICTQGIQCTTGQVTGLVTNPGTGNRNLADFSSVTIDPNGCPIFVYADDGAIKSDQSNAANVPINNAVARQIAGCFPTAAAVASMPVATPAIIAAPTSAAGGTAVTNLPNTAAAAAGRSGPALAVAVLLGAAAYGLVRRRRRSTRWD